MIYRFAYFPLIGIVFGSAGCGASFAPVSGVVTLDSTPVEGATVTFVAEDGKTTYSAMTNATGNFELSQGEQVGALPGTYKVSVVKYKNPYGSEEMTAGDGGYIKAMEKHSKELKAASKPKSMIPGMPMPPGMATPALAPKSELPPIYASLTSTTLTVKVPLESSPVKLELSGAAGGSKKK